MFEIPKEIDLSQTDSYVVKVKEGHIEIEKNTTFMEKAVHFLGRHVYSDGWSYKTSKVRDAVDAEMQKVMKQGTWLAAHNTSNGKPIKEENGGHYEKTQQASMQLQNLKCLKQWVDKDLGTVVSETEMRPIKEKDAGTALYEEGLAFETGTATVKKDAEKALENYREAAKLGHVDALVKVAEDERRMYKKIQQDSASYTSQKKEPNDSLGNRLAIFYLENLHSIKTGPDTKYLLSAVASYIKAADQGNVDALYQLACLYHDLKPAKSSDSWIEKIFNAETRKHLVAAFPGDKKNTEHIAAYYYQQAYQGFKEAADQGCAYACYRLGCLSEETAGGQEASPSASVEWFKKAAELGSVDAQYKLGTLIEEGKGEGASKTAGEYYKEAAQGGNKDAQFRLGCAYEQGELEQGLDKQAARIWYEQAAAQGHGEARERLEKLGGSVKRSL